MFAALVLLVGTTLTGCSGGGDQSDSGPEGSPGATTSAPPRPTDAEYDEAYALYHGLAGVLNETNKRSSAYQDLVRKAWQQDPEGFRKAPRVIKAVRKQRAAAADRDAALAALAAQPAMADAELGAAYQTFATQYAAAAAYQDGFDDSFPLFLAVGTQCQQIFGVEATEAESFEAYATTWLERHREASAPCLKQGAGLASSGNEDVARLPARYARLVEERKAAVVGLRDQTATAQQSLKALAKADKRFTRDYARLTRFSERLAELVPVAAYEAVDPIFEDRVGETPSADPTPE